MIKTESAIKTLTTAMSLENKLKPKKDYEKLGFVPEFTQDPLPKRLIFEGIESYLIPIDPVAYNDIRYIKKKLVSHFITALNHTKNHLQEAESLVLSLQESLTDCYSRNLNPYTATKTTANSRYWRQRVILVKKQTKYQRILNLRKLSLCLNNISILKKIIKVIKELIRRPRNVCINQSTIFRLCQVIKVETEVLAANKIKAAEYLLGDIKNAMRFVPKLFTKPELCISINEEFLTSSMRFRDPLTFYLPETEESKTFEDFLRSRFSPIRYCEENMQPIENMIELTVEMMRSFANIKQPDLVIVLTSMAARYWFNRIPVCNDELSKCNQRLSSYISSMRLTPLSDLKPPRLLSKAFKAGITVANLFEGEKLLKPAVDQLFTCVFFTNPVDVAYNIHLIHLRLAGYVAGKISKDIHDKATLEGVAFMWKLLFIISDIPSPDSIFAFVTKWAHINCIPDILMQKCSVPLNVLKAFQIELQKKK